MSKIIAIGDTHGRRDWKKIVEQEADADKIVFIGDYFDTHEAISPGTQISNFYNILAFKKANPEKVILLMGNHDFHYLPGDQRYSGYQDKYEFDIRDAVESALNSGAMQIAWAGDGWLFTHAGVTKTWSDHWGLLSKEDIAGAINGLFWRTRIAFNFTFGASGDVYGGDPANGPLWVRPEALLSDKIDGYKQAVGHTTQESLNFQNETAFIDCIGTSGEFLKIVDGEPVIESE